MKKFTTIFAVVFLSTFLVAGSAMAIPLTTRLEGVLDGIAVDGNIDIDVYTGYISDNSDSTWEMTATGGSVATFIIELAGYANSNKFGVYDNGFYVQIFSGNETSGAQHTFSLMADGSVKIDQILQLGVTFTGNSFGYYLDSPDGIFHSDTSLNGDKADHMLAYQGYGEMVQLPSYNPAPWTSNEWILAWEDLNGLGDKDYEDLVVMVESVQPVPEPATMLLLGAGLIGLASASRKKLFKK